jgi:hypothetical protein
VAFSHWKSKAHRKTSDRQRKPDRTSNLNLRPTLNPCHPERRQAP